MASQLDIILRAIDKASGPVGNVTGSLGRLENASTGLVSRGLNPLTVAMGVGIRDAVGVGLRALGNFAGAIGESIGKASDMQQRIADITAVMGLAKNQIAPVSDLIQNLGLDPKLKVDANQAADAIEMLAKNGLSMDQILGGAARQTVLLANATGGDFSTAANIATDVMSLWNIKADQMKRAVDGISGVTIKSKFSIDDYRLAIAQAGGVAATVGVGFEDFNTIIAAISPSFASGSDAGTSFKTMLQRLIPQSKDAEELMTQLGLITADGSNQFFDAAGNLKSMSQIVGILNRSFANLTSEQRTNAFTTIFGTDAMRAASAMAGISQEQFDALRKSISDVDSEKQAAVRMDTLSGSMEILQGIIDSLKISIGGKFLPVFKDMVDAIAKFLTDNGPAIIQWAENLAGWFDSLVKSYFPPFLDRLNNWWTAIKNILTSLGDFQDLAVKWLGAIADFFKPLTDLIGKFVSWNDVLVALGILVAYTVLPWIGSLVAALAVPLAIFTALVLAVAAVRTAWEKDWGGIREKVGSVLSYLYDRFHLLWETITINAPLALQEIWSWVNGNDTSFAHLNMIWTAAKVTGMALFKDLKDFVSANLPIWTKTLGSWGIAAWQWIADSVSIVWEWIKKWGSATLDWVGAHLPDWIKKLGSWGVAAWQWIVDSIPVVLTTLGKWLASLSKWFIDNSPTFGRMLNDFFIGAFNFLGSFIPTVIHKIGDTLEALMKWSSTSAVEGFKKGIAGLVSGAQDSGDNAGAALLRAFGNIVVSLIEVAIQIGTAFVFWIGQSILSWAGLDVNLWKFYDHIKEVTNKFDLKTLGNLLMGLFKQGISAGWAAVQAAWNSLWTAFANSVNNSINSFKEHVYNPIQAAMIRMRDAIRSIDLSVNFAIVWASLVNAYNSAVTSFQQHVYNPVSAAMIRIRDAIRQIDLAYNFWAIWNALVNAYNSAVGSFNQHVYSPVRDAIQQIVNAIRSIDIAGSFWDAWMNVVRTFDTAIAGFRDHVYNPVHDAVDRIVGAIKSVDLFGSMWGALNRITDGFNGWLNVFWNNVWGPAQGIANRIIEGINSIDLFGKMWDVLNKITSGFNSWLDSWWQNMFDRSVDIGKHIIDGIISGIDYAWNWLRDKLNWLGSIVPDWVKNALGIHSPSKVFIDIGQNIMQAMSSGIAQTASLPQQALLGAASGLIQTGQQAVQTVANTTNQYNVTFPNMGAVQNPSQEAIKTMNILTGVYA